MKHISIQLSFIRDNINSRAKNSPQDQEKVRWAVLNHRMLLHCLIEEGINSTWHPSRRVRLKNWANCIPGMKVWELCSDISSKRAVQWKRTDSLDDPVVLNDSALSVSDDWWLLICCHSNKGLVVGRREERRRTKTTKRMKKTLKRRRKMRRRRMKINVFVVFLWSNQKVHRCR